MPLHARMVMSASKQSTGCFSWPLESPPGLWNSIRATVMVWTFLVALSLDIWSIGTSSDLAKRIWSWSCPLPILLACPGLFGWCFEVRRLTLGPLFTSPSRHLHPDALMSERSMRKYWGTLWAQLLAKRSTIGVPQCLNNLWQAGSPRPYSWAFLPLHRASAQGFDTPLRCSGQTIMPFLWHFSRIFLARPQMLSIWKETVFPSMIPGTFDRPSTLFPVPGYWYGCSCPFL